MTPNPKPKPFYHEQSVTIDGATYRLVINFLAIDATESVLGGRAYPDILDDLLAGKSVGVQARVVWGLLREHHPELTLEEAAALTIGAAGDTIGLAIGELILAAFPALVVGEEAKGKNPPKPRGASRSSTRRGASRKG